MVIAMKKLVLIAALAACTAASAEEAFVYPRANAAGETIPRTGMLYSLSLTQKCALPIANAANMRRAEIFNRPKPDVGCWGRSLQPGGAEAVIIGPYGNVETANLMNFKRVKLSPNGDGEVLGAAVSMEEFMDKVKAYHQSLQR